MNNVTEWGDLAPLKPLTPFPTKTASLLQTQQVHNDFVGGMAIDEQCLYTSSEDGSLRVWDRKTLKRQAVLKQGSMPINFIALSPNGAYLATADDNNEVHIYQRQDDQSFVILHTLRGHTGYVSKLAFAQHKLVSASKDGTLKVWNYQTGKLLDTLTGHSDWVYALATSPDGRFAISSALNSSLKVWDLERGILLDNLLEGSHLMYVLGMSIGGENDTAKGNKEAPNDIIWIEKKNIVVTLAKDIVAWDTTTWEVLWHTDTSNRNKIKRVRFVERYNMLITAGDKVEGWNLTTGEQMFSSVGHEGKELYSCEVWNEEVLYTGDKNGQVRAWSIDTLLNQPEPIQHISYVHYLFHEPTSKRIATTAYDGSLIVYDENACPLKQVALPEAFGSKILGNLQQQPHKIWVSTSGKLHKVDLAEARIAETFQLDNKLVEIDELIPLSDAKVLGVNLSYLPRLIDLEKQQITVFEMPYTLTHYYAMGTYYLCTSYPTKPLDNKKSDHKSLHKPRYKKMKGLQENRSTEKSSPFVVMHPSKIGEIEEFWLPDYVELTSKHDKVYPMLAYPISEKVVAVLYNTSDLGIWDIEAKRLIVILPSQDEYYAIVCVFAGKIFRVGKAGLLQVINARSLQEEESVQLGNNIASCYLDKERGWLHYVENKKTWKAIDLKTLKPCFEIRWEFEIFRFLAYQNKMFVGTHQGRTFAFELPAS